ncbi:MAG: response regulator, partial [Desulfobacteraceae bacterium]|nr:response regulator [Desulfobacteraceae bacterium]
VILRDVTQKQKLEHALRESEERYHSVMEAAPDPMVIYDMEGKVTYLNLAFTSVFGWTLEEVSGKKLDFVPQGNMPETIEVINRVSRGEKNVPFETRRYTKDRKIIDVQGSSSTFKDYNGNPVGAVVLFRDVTQKRKMEQELKQYSKNLENMVTERTRELVFANRAKSQFLANMSHEIRTPMNGIIGMNSLLHDTDLTNKQLEYSNGVKSSAEYLMTLINDILDFSKVEAGKLELKEIDFNIHTMLDDFISSMSFKAEQKSLELIYTIDPTIPPFVKGDPGRLRQVLNNLIENALKFTHKGKIIVRGKLKKDEDKEMILEFSVEDTGIGITADKQKTLFDNFTQADPSDTRKYGGSGLGLAISKQLTELMNGKIWVSRKKDTGSVFTFTIVVKKSDKKLPHDDSTDICSKHSVLIVDDNPINRKVLHGLCNSLKWGADEANNGQQAVKMLEEKEYDLVFMDIQMPVMDGYEATEHIRNPDSNVLNHDIPIIAVTANANDSNKKRCLEIGMNDFLAKPVRSQHIKKALTDVI